MKRGGFSLFAGVLLISASLILTGYNLKDAHRAEENAASAAAALEERIAAAPGQPMQPLPVVTVEQNDYMGLLEIPSLGLKLPVMAEWDYKKLKSSPCRFYGFCETGDLVLCAHNYPAHFGRIPNMEIGAEVYLTTADQCVHRYTVTNLEMLSAASVEEMTHPAPDWDLTLFTCTLNGQARWAVRCGRAA